MGNALSMPNGLTPCPQGAQRCVAPKNDGAGPPESDQRKRAGEQPRFSG